MPETLSLTSHHHGTFFDTAVVHVLTTAMGADRLRELYPQGRFEARRFRPNMVVQISKANVTSSWRRRPERWLQLEKPSPENSPGILAPAA